MKKLFIISTNDLAFLTPTMLKLNQDGVSVVETGFVSLHGCHTIAGREQVLKNSDKKADIKYNFGITIKYLYNSRKWTSTKQFEQKAELKYNFGIIDK